MPRPIASEDRRDSKLPREKQYESAAERQRAYRVRKSESLNPPQINPTRKESMTQEKRKPTEQEPTELEQEASATETTISAALVPVAKPLSEKRVTMNGKGFSLYKMPRNVEMHSTVRETGCIGNFYGWNCNFFLKFGR